LRRKSKNITNLTNLTFKRFNSSLVKPLNKECSLLTEYPALNTLALARLGSCQSVNSTKLTDFFKDKNLNPVYIYENLALDSTQKKIKSETLNLSGIYLILNKITLDYYIGSASTNRFFARFSNHLVNFHGSKIVKAAVRNYKISQFAFIILELFPYIVVTKENNKILLDLEDFYIKSLLPNYNILTEAGSSFGYKHTEITRINMMSNYSIERRLKIGNLNKNKIFSKETIEKMSPRGLTRKKSSYSESCKQTILNMKKKSKSLIIYNLNYTVYGEYPSITEASKSLNCNEKTIRRALKTEKKLLKRR
jgi:group I intron endonuclease